DVDLLGNCQLEAGLTGADTQVIVLEKADADALVQAADPLQDLAPGQQAEARQAPDSKQLAGEGLTALRRKCLQPVQAIVAGADALRVWGGVGDRADQSDGGPVAQGGRYQTVEPSGNQDDIVVQEDDIAAACLGQRLVATFGKAEIGRIVDDLD